MFPRFESPSTRLNPKKTDLFVIDERVESTHRITPSSNTGYYGVGQAPLNTKNLVFDLPPNNTLEISHYHWIWMRTHDGPKEIVCALNVCDPVSERFIDRILEGLRTRSN